LANGRALTALEVPVRQIAPDPDQPRRSIEPDELGELVLSVRARGVIQPLLVTPHPSTGARGATPYQLIAGERRLKAAMLAGLETVPIVLREDPLTAADRLMLQLDENDGELRRELSLYERASALVRALKGSGLRKEAFARRHQKSASWISHYVTLGKMEGLTREALKEGFLTGLHATRLFKRLPQASQQELLDQARRDREPITPQRVEMTTRRLGLPTSAAPSEMETNADRALEPTNGTKPASGVELEQHPLEELSASTEVDDELSDGRDSGAAADLEIPKPSSLPPSEPSPFLSAQHLSPEPPVSAAAGFLEAGQVIAQSGAARLRVQSSSVSIVLTSRQLSSLLILLGEEPRGTAADQVKQLLAILT
jgi:ParB family chromosome partitioning protein